ncbi:hypothetical protein KP509_32G039700 [Ceratopteris richardii]|uniref:non-specific serine/threonine protein kinase n=1 Tax=Ceratopteris richardii TaxID=49495 RepID=A0A8T2QUL4_CERRI|nr:hypothetical protein KP509_32G039700 [Ceratopteris richardii]
MTVFGTVGKYELGRTLGEGTFAKVKYARHVGTGEPVAIKIIDKERILKPKMIEREISTMKLIKHPNVVQLKEVLASKKRVYIVLEFVDGCELFDLIVQNGRMEPETARKYFQQLIHAVDYCHSRGVYHRDLKPENLLLDSKGDLKISDFGLSALSHQRWEDGLLHTTCGTPNYVAPEVINEKGYDGAAADIWSCGVILYVLLAGFLPFDEYNTYDLYKKIEEAEFTFPSWFPEGAKHLVTRILDANPKSRMTMPELLNDEWFKINDTVVKCSYDDFSTESIDGIFKSEEENFAVEDTTPSLINAFEIISMSEGLDLSGLFKEQKCLIKNESRFTVKHPANEILKKMVNLANTLGFRTRRKNYKLKMLSQKPGRKGCLAVASEASSG